MRKLIQYDLEFDQIETYFKKYLYDRHKLSDELRKNIDFAKGHFYTLLTEDADLSRLYKFEVGEIIPQNPIGEIYIESLGGTFTGRWVNSLDEELSHFIYEKIKNNHFSFLVEDLIQSSTDPEIVDLYHQVGVYFGEEVFYLITEKNLKKEFVDQIFKECGCWDLIGVLFDKNNIEFINKEIKGKDFSTICSHASIIIISAYDGEGYLIWERNKRTV